MSGDGNNPNGQVSAKLPEPKAVIAPSVAIKAAAIPLAGAAAYWTMDAVARGYVIEEELKSSPALGNKYKTFNEVAHDLEVQLEGGTLKKQEYLAKSFENRAGWRKFLYENLSMKGLDNFYNKMRHISRSNKQKVMIDGITVGSVALAALFSIANTSWVGIKSHTNKDDGKSV